MARQPRSDDSVGLGADAEGLATACEGSSTAFLGLTGTVLDRKNCVGRVTLDPWPTLQGSRLRASLRGRGARWCVSKEEC